MHATEHRCGVKVSGPRLSSQITGTDPLKDNLEIVECKALDPNDEDAVQTSLMINSLSDAITRTLLEHPIN